MSEAVSRRVHIEPLRVVRDAFGLSETFDAPGASNNYRIQRFIKMAHYLRALKRTPFSVFTVRHSEHGYNAAMRVGIGNCEHHIGLLIVSSETSARESPVHYDPEKFLPIMRSGINPLHPVGHESLIQGLLTVIKNGVDQDGTRLPSKIDVATAMIDGGIIQLIADS